MSNQNPRKSRRNVVLIPLASLFWFLILPLDFKVGWSFFGGLKILKAQGFFVGDWMEHEIAQSKGFYDSHWHLLILVLASVGLGVLTVFVLDRLFGRRNKKPTG